MILIAWVTFPVTGMQVVANHSSVADVYQYTTIPADKVTLNTVSWTPVETTGVPYLYVSFKSDPPGAQLQVDDKEKGSTPISVYFSSSGDHTFRLSLSGYEDYQGQFSIPGTTEEDITLSPITTAVISTVTTIPTVHVPVTSLTPTVSLNPGVLLTGLCLALVLYHRKNRS
jgi:hypothetical protein